MQKNSPTLQKSGFNKKRHSIAGKPPFPFEDFRLNWIHEDSFFRFLNERLTEVFKSFFPIVSGNETQIVKLKKLKVEKPTIEFDQVRKVLGSYEFGVSLTLTLTSRQKDQKINFKIHKNIKEGIRKWLEQKFDVENSKLVSATEKKLVFKVNTAKRKDRKEKFEITFTLGKKIGENLVFDFELLKEETIFFGNYPMISSKGTFMINGVEKVIVHQLVRVPGVFYKVCESPLEFETYSGEIILKRGTWIDFVTKMNKRENEDGGIDFVPVLEVSLNKSRSNNILVSNVLTAFGLKKEFMLDLFNNAAEIVNSYSSPLNIDDYEQAIRAVYSRVSANLSASLERKKDFIFERFFGSERFFLSRFGRYKIQQKLSLFKLLQGRVLAEDLVDSKTKKTVFKKGTMFENEDQKRLEDFFKKGNNFVDLGNGQGRLQKVKVYVDNFKQETSVNVLGVDPENNLENLLLADILVIISGILNLSHDIGEIDDIDSLANRSVRLIDELVEEHFVSGLQRVSDETRKKLDDTFLSKYNHKIVTLINFGPLHNAVRDFFNLSQLSQFLDQTNPLTELCNKRRITVLGRGGLKRESSSTKVRDVHSSFFGKICPIETPEGPNIGLIANLSYYVSVNKWRLLETFYRPVVDGRVLNEKVALSAIEEKNVYIAPATTRLTSDFRIANKTVTIYYHDNLIEVPAEEVQYIGYAPEQMFSVAAAMIPFLENNDANRALMGANMQKQALPLIQPQSPLIGTGLEWQVARDSGFSLVSRTSGRVVYADSCIVTIEEDETKRKKNYYPYNFLPSNQRTALSHEVLVNKGDLIEPGQVLADGTSIQDGELALGKDLLVGFMTWKGYNYEDALIVSDRLVRDNVFTSLHIEEYEIKRMRTKIGEEEFTRDVINASEHSRRFLDEEGIVEVGSEVEPGDILVGKVTPKEKGQSSPEDILLRQLFKGRERNIENNSLFVPNGVYGVVQKIQRFSEKELSDSLSNDTIEIIKIYVARKIFIKEGDKMASRHGNKGVISRVLTENSMPYLADGTPLDIMINPLGVPSRMNVGQLLEMHFGLAAKKLGIKIKASIFHKRDPNTLTDILKKAGVSLTGRETLYDGETGEKFDRPIAVGYIYYMKLSHIVESKIHAREIGPYSLITQQPLKGKAQNGGQRFGEMEVWALESYGAAHNLREILTIKSDDIKGRNLIYWALIKKMPRTLNFNHFAESFNVLFVELRSLCINLEIIPKSDEELINLVKGTK